MIPHHHDYPIFGSITIVSVTKGGIVQRRVSLALSQVPFLEMHAHAVSR